MLAQLYKCPKHGEIWRVEAMELIDTERDDCEWVMVCPDCYAIVEPIMRDGVPLYHGLTEEEMYWELSYDEEDEFPEGIV
jgi:hypothetical protein